MVRIGFDADEFAVVYGRNHAATRRAHGAVGLDLFSRDLEILLNLRLFQLWYPPYNSN
jgi:hypothetical protein